MARKSPVYAKEPVPQSVTGRRDEYYKVLEIILVKELGKIAP